MRKLFSTITISRVAKLYLHFADYHNRRLFTLNKFDQLEFGLDYFLQHPRRFNVGKQASQEVSKWLDSEQRDFIAGALERHRKLFCDISFHPDATGYDFMIDGCPVEEKKRTLFECGRVVNGELRPTERKLLFVGNNRQNNKVAKFIFPTFNVSDDGRIIGVNVFFLEPHVDDWKRDSTSKTNNFSTFSPRIEHLTDPNYVYQQVLGTLFIALRNKKGDPYVNPHYTYEPVE